MSSDAGRRAINALVRRFGGLQRESLKTRSTQVPMSGEAISEHLGALYWEACRTEAALSVEIGTRGGASTKVLVEAVRCWGGSLLSIDPEPTEFTSSYGRWHFVQGLGQQVGAEFELIAQHKGLPNEVAFWFLDSSHLYEETVEELEAWAAHWTDDVLIAFHDTHMAETYVRSDGTRGRGWDNDRAVARACEEYFGWDLDWSRPQVVDRGNWCIRHSPYGSGFTFAQRRARP